MTEPNTKRKIDCRPISWRGRSCKEVCTKECPYIHKPDENENNSDRRVRLGKLKDTSCLGEKLVAELRSKNPYHIDNDFFKTDVRGLVWLKCCDELEKMLKEKRK